MNGTPSNACARCIARPSVSNEGLSVNDRGQVVYRLEHSFHDATTYVVLDPMDRIARLATLVPRPRAHLTRYHGVFAPNFKHRHRIAPNAAHPAAREPRAVPLPPMSWMQPPAPRERVVEIVQLRHEAAQRFGRAVAPDHPAGPGHPLQGDRALETAAKLRR